MKPLKFTSSKNRGFLLRNMFQGRQKRFHYPQRSLPQFSVICKALLGKGRHEQGTILASLVLQFHCELMEKLTWWRTKFDFYLDNAQAQTNAISTTKIVEMCYELLPNPPYASNLTSVTSFILKNWRNSLVIKGDRTSNKEVITETTPYCRVWEIVYFGRLNEVGQTISS